MHLRENKRCGVSVATHWLALFLVAVPHLAVAAALSAVVFIPLDNLNTQGTLSYALLEMCAGCSLVAAGRLASRVVVLCRQRESTLSHDLVAIKHTNVVVRGNTIFGLCTDGDHGRRCKTLDVESNLLSLCRQGVGLLHLQRLLGNDVRGCDGAGRRRHFRPFCPAVPRFGSTLCIL